jgi:hypothetical protein
MRFYLRGPRILAGIRPGVSFGPEDFRPARQATNDNTIDADHSFLYVIEGGGLCKIGRTTNPNARLAALQTQFAAPLTFRWIGAPKGDVIAIEKETHRLLNQYRKAGEWFRCSPDLAVAAIHSVAYKRSQPVLDLSVDQAAQIVRVANQPQRKPTSLFDRIVVGLVKFGLAVIVVGWIFVLLARALRF